MAAPFADRIAEEYGEIVVVGGGCYGAYYARQLGRAAAAGVLRWQSLVVVDRDAACQVARERVAEPGVPPWALPRVVVAEWGPFFERWLSGPGTGGRDAVVPSPLMPHLFFEYLDGRVRSRWPQRNIHRAPLGTPAGTPWERVAEDGTSYVSHATWMCPINCIEPRICPHTRDVRTWTMPASLDAWARAQPAGAETLLGPFTFHCTHRAYGVGMVDREPIVGAEMAIGTAAAAGPVRALIATASHCHGAAAMLVVGPLTRAGAPASDHVRTT